MCQLPGGRRSLVQEPASALVWCTLGSLCYPVFTAVLVKCSFEKKKEKKKKTRFAPRRRQCVTPWRVVVIADTWPITLSEVQVFFPEYSCQNQSIQFRSSFAPKHGTLPRTSVASHTSPCFDEVFSATKSCSCSEGAALLHT